MSIHDLNRFKDKLKEWNNNRDNYIYVTEKKIIPEFKKSYFICIEPLNIPSSIHIKYFQLI